MTKEYKKPVVILCKTCPCLGGFDQTKIQVQFTLQICEQGCQQLACKFDKRMLHKILGDNPHSIHSEITTSTKG